MDNIITLQETIHSFKHMKGTQTFIILKIDFKKAYNHIE